MNISSTPFIRNDYWPDYNDINMLNQRIDEAENETSLVNSRLTNDIENVSNNLNSYKNEMADTVITNNIIVNNLNANYAIGKYANFANTNTDNAYIENLTVNMPVFDITLNTPHVENITSIGGNFYDAKLVNAMLDGNGVLGNVEINNAVINTANVSELFVNTQPEPITSSAVLGYDSEGRVIPIHAAYDVGFPEDANYLFTDHAGTAFPGTAATEVGISSNLITAYAVKNAIDNVTADVNNSFNIINDALNDVDSWMNNIENDVNNRFEDVNNTANNLLDNVDYLKNIVESSLLPANITGWNSSSYPVILQGITEFAVEPLSADYYPISPEADRILFNGGYYEKNGNNYVKQDITVTTYNTYNIIEVDLEHEYRMTIDFETYDKSWSVTNGGTLQNGSFIYKDGNSIEYLGYIKFNASSQIAEGNTYGRTTKIYRINYDQSFYIIESGKMKKVENIGALYTTDDGQIYNYVSNYTYPNTNPYQADVICDSSGQVITDTFPLYTEIETMTAYVGDKAKLSVSGTKATLALPGLYWTKANMDMAFYNCSSFNQKMIIQNSVTSMASTFEGCSNFNQPDMLIYSQNITNMTNAFKDCHINNVHIPASVPKDTSNFMYNCLVNGNTGITFPAANIFNDLN